MFRCTSRVGSTPSCDNLYTPVPNGLNGRSEEVNISRAIENKSTSVLIARRIHVQGFFVILHFEHGHNFRRVIVMKRAAITILKHLKTLFSIMCWWSYTLETSKPKGFV